MPGGLYEDLRLIDTNRVERGVSRKYPPKEPVQVTADVDTKSDDPAEAEFQADSQWARHDG